MSVAERVRRLRSALLLALLIAAVAACGARSTAKGVQVSGTQSLVGTVRLYTSYDQAQVDALLAAYRSAAPGVNVEVFRAPTGQLAARIATEQRSGGVRGDVLLLSDPLSMQQYAAQGMLRRWTPPEVAAVPAEARTDTFWGVASLDVVVVSAPGKAPTSWQDLADPSYRGSVAVPDPSFAGSAFGALGYFAGADGYGLDYYRRLKANGAVQVQTPADVLTGVAEGRFTAGMTLDFSARAAVAKGSPVVISAPAPGAVRLYAPVAVFGSTPQPQAAESFANFLLTRPAQQVLAAQDRHPIRADVPARAPAMPEVAPDWPQIFQRQAKLQADYSAIFGG